MQPISWPVLHKTGTSTCSHEIVMRRRIPSCQLQWLFFFSSRRRHTRSLCDWSSDVCSSDLFGQGDRPAEVGDRERQVPTEPAPEPGGGCPRQRLDGRAAERGVEGICESLGLGREIGRASCRKECRSRWSPYH